MTHKKMPQRKELGAPGASAGEAAEIQKGQAKKAKPFKKGGKAKGDDCAKGEK